MSKRPSLDKEAKKKEKKESSGMSPYLCICGK